MSAAIRVVAGILRDAQGRVLVAQRPEGKHLAGTWEFPGGKCEDGESPEAALARELHEELGIQIGAVQALIRVPWQYPGKRVRLMAYHVASYAGVPQAHEHEALRWCMPDALGTLAMPDADRPIVAALRLPQAYAITPEPGSEDDVFLAAFERVLARGIKLIQLRVKTPSPPRRRMLACAARELALRAGAQLLLNADIVLARELGLGVHLPSADLLRLGERPLAREHWVGASCHDANELAHAVSIGVDFAVLGAVAQTTTHASTPLGWARFAALCEAAPLPIYALGGVMQNDLARARACGAIGIAGIRTFWD